MGSQMDSESVKKLANELDISGCGSVNLEVCPRLHPYISLNMANLVNSVKLLVCPFLHIPVIVWLSWH